MGRMFQRGRYGLNQGEEEGRLRLALSFSRRNTMPKGPFVASQFVATKWSSTEEKASFGNLFVLFVDSDFERGLFSKKFYNRLSNCFAHIAHFNCSQFYQEWFSSLSAQVRFLEHTLKFPCYGDPQYTFSDVEREIQREVRNRNYLARYQLRLAEEERAGELALLERLEGKYRPRPEDLEDSPTPQAAEGSRTAVAPVQGLLF